MSNTILVQRSAAIATVVLNNPDKLNALTFAMWMRLGEVVRELEADDGVRCTCCAARRGRQGVRRRRRHF